MAIAASAFAQKPEVSQTLRGTILDLETRTPLPGVSVGLLRDSLVVAGGATDANGAFRFNKVPPGRYTLKTSYVGYERLVIPNIIVGSGKEVMLDLLMTEASVKVKEVVVQAFRTGEVRNEMALISSKVFSVEETERYAGSRGDPARMAANFAGAQGADDTRNDIVVRGNAPGGVVWRMEGIDLFNPNHFNIPGTTGGSVSVLNNKYLGKSDFFTGAFPAEYGNGTAAVFDLYMRNGNNEKYEHGAQIGVLGTEVFSEGPLSKTSKASYLVSYRYSSLALFQKVKFNLGTNAIPYYQDAAFRLNFPLRNNASLAFFGIGGDSKIALMISDQKAPSSNDLYGANDRDQYFSSAMGIIGTTYTRTLNPRTYMRTTLALQGNAVDADHRYVYRRITPSGNYAVDSVLPMMNYAFKESKINLAWMLNHKINQQWTLKTGVNLDQYMVSFVDSFREIDTSSAHYHSWLSRWDSKANPFLLRTYAQVRWKPSDRLTISAGLHAQYFSLSKSFSGIEPRLGLALQLPNRQSMSLGLGMHSQAQTTYLYYYRLPNSNYQPNAPHNLNLGFTRSIHAVLGYDRMLTERLHMHAETYYQYLYDAPVEQRSSSLSLLNSGSGFSRYFPDTLVNKGMGMNYGIEITIDRSFHKQYFFMLTAAMFDARYTGSDGVWRNTDFNGKFAFNLLATREWNFNKRNVFSMGGKLTWIGGRWYGPVDTTLTMKNKEVFFADGSRNTLQFKDYFRADIKVKVVFNRARTSHEIGVDLVNIANTKNALKLTYSPDPANPQQGRIVQENQLGFLPLVYYKIDF